MQGKRGANAFCCACHTDRGGRSRAPAYVLAVAAGRIWLGLAAGGERV